MFYLLSLLTGILECGWIAYGAVHSLPLWQILCYPLSYHIGNLFPIPFSLNKKQLRFIAVLSLICSVFTFVTSGTLCNVLTYISLFGISASIQSIRSNLKNDSNRLMKRVFRVCGFIFAPLSVFIPSIILTISASIALYSLKNYNGKCRSFKLSWQNGYSAVMLFHQLHYFFYAHITLSAMSLVFTHKYQALGTVFSSLLFCGTWITYMSVEPILSKFTKRLLPPFFIGHTGICILLFIMSLINDNTIFTILWLITGFGGGVVYTIAPQAISVNCYDKNSMTISENIGHTLGLLTAVIISLLSYNHSLQIMLILGSVSAMSAIITMIFTLKKRCNYENIKQNR